MLYVTKPSLPPLEEYVKEISTLWDSRILTNMGVKHYELETALCEFLKVKNMKLFANGHLALEAALQIFDFPQGAEVITTPFTFISTTNAILRSGLIPVFCDVKDDDGTIDPMLIEPLITSKTAAILPVHVYGNLCDVDAIYKIAEQYKLKVIYDAAHAFGVTRKPDNAGAGSFGDISMFSFHATKVFHTFEGGGLAFNDSSLSVKLQAWRNFGYLEGDVILPGGNAKMCEAHAAIGLCNLRHLEENISARKRNFELYCNLLSGYPGLSIITPHPHIKPNYSYFPIRINAGDFGLTRDGLFDILEEKEIHTRKYFELTSSYKSILGKNKPPANTPVAERFSEEVLILPLYPELEETSIAEICDIIKHAGKSII